MCKCVCGSSGGDGGRRGGGGLLPLFQNVVHKHKVVKSVIKDESSRKGTEIASSQ